MKNIHQLLNQIADQENQLLQTQFLAPCVRGGQLRTKVAGMVYNFNPQPSNFEGWGIFQPVSPKQAKLTKEADLPEIVEYLQNFPAIRLFLAHILPNQAKHNPGEKQTWLAYPVNESDMQQRTGFLKPVPVYLVSDGAAFETIIARWDGKNWWFEEIDRRADIEPLEHLKSALKNVIYPKKLRFKGITPEMRIIYELVAQKTQEFQAEFQQKRDEKLLTEALKMGGGTLEQFRERDDYWLVEWTTSTGESHSSAISKNDLTVISAGICLSGEDSKFDLQSLVGVVESSG